MKGKKLEGDNEKKSKRKEERQEGQIVRVCANRSRNTKHWSFIFSLGTCILFLLLYSKYHQLYLLLAKFMNGKIKKLKFV